MHAHRELSVLFAAAAAVLGPIAVALPDGNPGSPRAIVTALALGLLAASVVLRGSESS